MPEPIDPTKAADDDPTKVTDPKPDPTLDAVKALAEDAKKSREDFLKALSDARAAQVPAPAPIAIPAAKDPAEEFAKLSAECDALYQEGKATEAMSKFAMWLSKQNASSQIDPTTTPTYRHMVESTKRDVRSDNKDVFDRWGKEVEAIVQGLPSDKRLLHAEWEDAARRVRAAHQDEILVEKEAEIRKKIEEEYKGRLAPLAAGSRGSAGTELTTGLSEIDLAVVKAHDLNIEQYKKAKKTVEAYTTDQGIFDCPFMDEQLPERGRINIKPGRF